MKLRNQRISLGTEFTFGTRRPLSPVLVELLHLRPNVVFGIILGLGRAVYRNVNS